MLIQERWYIVNGIDVVAWQSAGGDDGSLERVLKQLKKDVNKDEESQVRAKERLKGAIQCNLVASFSPIPRLDVSGLAFLCKGASE